MASARVFRSLGGTSGPFSPLVTTLGIPPTLDATTGFPVAFASSSVRPKPSDLSILGRTRRSDAAW